MHKQLYYGVRRQYSKENETKVRSDSLEVLQTLNKVSKVGLC